LIAAMGLMAIAAEEEPDQPAEILGISAEDARVEAEIDRAGEAVDGEFERDARAEAVTAARLGDRLALRRQHLDLPQLGDDLLRRAPLPCHVHPFRGHTGLS
jgi:hypothetical protein